MVATNCQIIPPASPTRDSPATHSSQWGALSSSSGISMMTNRFFALARAKALFSTAIFFFSATL